MALTDPPDTLAHHQSRVLTAHRGMGHVPCSAVAARVKAFMAADQEKGTVPESEALWFYGLNHGMALVAAEHAPLEPLPPERLDFVRFYHAKLGPKAVRAFYYLLLICTRESRHNKSLAKDAPKMAKLFGQAVASFHVSIKGGEAAISQAFIDTPPDATIGQYVRSLQWAFYNSTWNGGYGGAKWGKVADCLVRFVTGEFTAEMMLDTNWTLCHNNGPIFNKGLMYSMYNPVDLVRVLDVQRSGQVPEAIMSDQTIQAYTQADLIARVAWMHESFPGKLGKYVDWYVVEALGAVQKYPADKKKQAAQHGMSAKANEAEKQAVLADAAKAAAALKAKEDYDKTHFEVMPGLVVKKFEPVREAA